MLWMNQLLSKLEYKFEYFSLENLHWFKELLGFMDYFKMYLELLTEF